MLSCVEHEQRGHKHIDMDIISIQYKQRGHEHIIDTIGSTIQSRPLGTQSSTPGRGLYLGTRAIVDMVEMLLL